MLVKFGGLKMRRLTLQQVNELRKINETLRQKKSDPLNEVKIDPRLKAGLDKALKSFNELSTGLNSPALKLITKSLGNEYRTAIVHPDKMRILASDITSLTNALGNAFKHFPSVLANHPQNLPENWEGLPVLTSIFVGSISEEAESSGLEKTDGIELMQGVEACNALMKAILSTNSDYTEVLNLAKSTVENLSDDVEEEKAIKGGIKNFISSTQNLYKTFVKVMLPETAPKTKIGKWLANKGINIGAKFPKFVNDRVLKTLFMEIMKMTTKSLNELADNFMVQAAKGLQQAEEITSEPSEDLSSKEKIEQSKVNPVDTAKDVAKESGIDPETAKAITAGIINYVMSQGGKISGEDAIQKMAVEIAKNLKK
jgi:hypothetical protein